MAIKRRGSKYLAVLFVGYATDGKRIEHAKTFRLRKDAERYEREQRALLSRGEWVQPTGLTVGQYLDQWEQGALKLGDQRDRTKNSYLWLLNSYVRPSLGNLKLCQLTRPRLQQLAANLLAQPKKRVETSEATHTAPVETLSPVTVRRALAALSVALNGAVEARLLGSNPAQRISLPRARRREVKWLGREEVIQLIDGTTGDRHGPLWALLVTTGMRPGEALGLFWDHVDCDAKLVRIQQSLIPKKRGENGSTWVLDEPKTHRSRRAVPISDDMTRRLRALRAKQAAERLEAGPDYRSYTGGGFVFARSDGEPYRRDALLQLFQRTLRKIGLPRVSLYSLRHGHASLLLEAGVPLKIVSERLGHSSIQLTADVYSHVSDQLQQQAVTQFEAYMTTLPPRVQIR